MLKVLQNVWLHVYRPLKPLPPSLTDLLAPVRGAEDVFFTVPGAALGLLEPFARNTSFHFILQSQKMGAEEIHFMPNYIVSFFRRTSFFFFFWNLGIMF